MFVCHLVLDDQTGWPTMSNFAKLWSVSIIKSIFYNLNWKSPRTQPGLWGTQQRFVWLPSSPGMRPRPSGETWYARWGTLSSQRQRQWQQQRQRQDNGNHKGKDKDSNKDNGKDKDNNRDQDRVGKHESQGRFFFASWMFQANIASIHNVFSCIVDKLCNLFIHNVLLQLWINSRGLTISVDDDSPLSVSINDPKVVKIIIVRNDEMGWWSSSS